MKGAHLRDEGMQRALRKTGEGWSERAIKALSEFCQARKKVGEPQLLIEEFREYAETFCELRTERVNAWGPLARIAVREGILRCTGERARSMRPSAHARQVFVYEAV